MKNLRDDRAGALLCLDAKGSVGLYYPLQIKQTFSLLSSAGSNLHLDMDGLEQQIGRFLDERLEGASPQTSAKV
jgi:hypothetical protein